MKELSIEEKAKAYDEALEKAREALNDGTISSNTIAYLQDIFPELRESEDKKIRKALIEGFKSHSSSFSTFSGISDDDILAWLEKQSNNADKDEPKDYNSIDPHFGKPINKDEPKFHEGEWIIHHGTENIYQVVDVIDNQYQLKYGDNYTIQNYADVDRCARLWDITKDAKDGDVLVDGNVILMFRGIGNTRWDDVIDYHCYYDCYRKDFIVQEDVEHWGIIKNNQLKPATKEQRDTLMKAMAYAGCIFDFDKKELNKIEQKPKKCIYSKDNYTDEDRLVLCDCCNEICKLKQGTKKRNLHIIKRELLRLKKKLKNLRCCNYDKETTYRIVE